MLANLSGHQCQGGVHCGVRQRLELSLTLSSAFLLRAAVEAASKPGATCCEPSPSSATLGLTLTVVLLAVRASPWRIVGNEQPQDIYASVVRETLVIRQPSLRDPVA